MTTLIAVGAFLAKVIAVAMMIAICGVIYLLETQSVSQEM